MFISLFHAAFSATFPSRVTVFVCVFSCRRAADADLFSAERLLKDADECFYFKVLARASASHFAGSRARFRISMPCRRAIFSAGDV